jgi:hypothetical protein
MVCRQLQADWTSDFVTDRIQKALSAFRLLKRQVDDSKTMRQLAATGQDRATVVVSANLLRDTKTPLRGECKKKNWRRYQIIPGAHDQ